MQTIVITSKATGRKTWLYEYIGRQGRRRLVSTYFAHIYNNQEQTPFFTFAVTRDSANVIFGKQSDRFGVNGECPPSISAYFGMVYAASRNGNCIILFSGRDDEGYYLTNQAGVKRRNILIHRGPATSYGCFSVAGGARGWKSFWRSISSCVPNNKELLQVVVQSR
jgi:hypothetical protein